VANQASTTCRLCLESTVETSTPPFLGRSHHTRIAIPAQSRVVGSLLRLTAFPRYAAGMSKLLLPILFLAILVGVPGCSLFHKKKPDSASHIYEGNAPTIKFTDKPDTPGGQITTY